MLTPREIIAEAWAISLRERAMQRWGFLYALLETMREVELIAYQTYFLYWFYRGETVGYWSVESSFFKLFPLWFFIALTLATVLLLVAELFVPALATGAIIGLGAKSYRKETATGGLILGLYNFFPVLEIHGMFILSNFSLVFSACSLILRYSTSPQLAALAIGMALIIWVIASTFRLLSIFSEEAVVIRKMGVFEAMGASFKLIVSHLSHFLFLSLLMVVIIIRILIRTILVLLVPLLAVSLGLLLALFLPPVVSYSIAGVVGLILLGFASYFLAYLHIFNQTVWTITFMELSKQKALDVIEG